MYAIVEIAGQQFKVQKDDEIFVHRLDSEPGKKLEISEVLLVDDQGKIKVGKPFVDGAKVTAKVLEHARGDKMIVFHKKRRKGYQKATGHRQDFTRIQVEKIALGSASKAKKVKEEEPKTDSSDKNEAAQES